ncbi:MAG: hypothetical protein LW825_03290 [Candidatus Jidaibacter sp.]|jgi:hypothetical protein|nr:hypothetical protein [Candidatus Jidaibacter sp.]
MRNNPKTELRAAIRGVDSYFEKRDKSHAVTIIEECVKDGGLMRETLDKLGSAGYHDTAKNLHGIDVYCEKINKLTSEHPSLKQDVTEYIYREVKAAAYNTLHGRGEGSGDSPLVLSQEPEHYGN